MDRKSINLLVLAVIFLILLFSLQSCSDMGFQAEGDYITGYIMVFDTNFIPGGYYALSMYANKSNPFDTLPLRSDTLIFVHGYDGRSRCQYRIYDVPKGCYFFAVTWIEYPPRACSILPVQGTWGCDTSRSCTSHKLVTFPNFTGIQYNILAWADTSKKLN